MTPELDLWTGTITDTGDEMWMAYTYNDEAVQFIHTEDHTQIWQGRTVVGDDFNRGRIEAHYSHSEDVVLLVAATGHDRPPEYERILDSDEFTFDFDTFDEETRKIVLQTLLATWAELNHIGSPEYPNADAHLDTLEPLATNEPPAEEDTVDPTGQELFNAGVDSMM